MSNNKLFIKACLLLLSVSDLYPFYLPPFVVSGDVEYQSIKGEGQELIYAPRHTQEAQSLFQKAQELHRAYEKSFDFHLTQKNYTGLASEHNQISNGFATFFPLLMNGFYSGGAASIDYFGSISWIDSLLVHEFAHTYQMDAKTGYSKTLQNIFGNNGLWFINPNYLLPTAVVEGNAVMNESRFGIGGRLYVGEHRALVYALSHDKKLDYTRLLNNHLNFPYRKEKYLVGGYLWAYIAERFGTDRANSYFKQHATHYFNPLRINRSFTEHFGTSYREVVRDFLDDLSRKSMKMQFLKGEEVGFAYFIADLNADEREIFWMQSQESGSNQKMLFEKSGKVQKEDSSLLMDKLFKIDGNFYTSSQAQVDSSHIVSGLFDKELNMVPSSKDFYIFDQRFGNEVSFYIPDSYSRAKLYKNRSFFDQADSSAILDRSGNVYYAKQDGEKRTLYKNDLPIAVWRGYSQKLLEVKDGSVYFIAPTGCGSSLYCATEGRVFRVSHADNIVDARLIDADHFLAVAVQGDGYHIIKAEIESETAQAPAWYEYALAPLTLSLLESDKASDAQAYSPFGNLHYGGIDRFSFGYGSFSGASGGAGLFFDDPMHQNELKISGYASRWVQAALLSYENRKYLLNYGLFAHYYKNSSFLEETGRLGCKVTYPLMKKEREQLTLSLTPTLVSQNQLLYTAVEGSISYSYGEYYALAYDWHRYKQARINYDYDQNGHTLSFYGKSIYEVYNAFFLKPEFAYHYSDDYVTLYNWDGTSFKNSDPHALSIYSRRLWFQTREGYKASLETAYAFKSGLYFDVWPFSLRKTALTLGANYVATKGSIDTVGSSNVSSQPFDFYELKAAIDFQLLGFHLAPFNIGFSVNYNSYLNDTESMIQIGINY